MVASEQIHQHLQSSLRDLSAEGWMVRLNPFTSRWDNARLRKLIDEADAHRVSETKSLGNANALWPKYHAAITEERANCAKLEESRKAPASPRFVVIRLHSAPLRTHPAHPASRVPDRTRRFSPPGHQTPQVDKVLPTKRHPSCQYEEH